jgi:hypothetical protein
VFYNFVRIHKTLRVTPAMAAGVCDRLCSMEDIIALIDRREALRAGTAKGWMTCYIQNDALPMTAVHIITIPILNGRRSS